MPEGPLERAQREVAAADDAQALLTACRSAHDTVRELAESRTGAATVAAAWSALGRSALACAGRILSGAAGTWYASGSIGRGDALPGSDLDTLFVRADTISADAAVSHAIEVHDLLAECGFPADANGATAARARFNRAAHEWNAGIGRWTADAAADRGVVMMGLLADAVPVTDGPDLRGQVGVAARTHPDALTAMLQDATHARGHVPSRLRVLATGDSGVDVKNAAVDPVVRIARWAALSCGSTALPTSERIRYAAGSRYLDDEDATALEHCYTIGSSIRWRLRAARWSPHAPVDDRVELSTLSPQDRTALRSIGRELNGVRRKLDYLASTSTFSEW
ncbi:putative nucleotidyltransferase substrate binding domain-containing protein [Mycobacterium sp. LTG2003]